MHLVLMDCKQLLFLNVPLKLKETFYMIVVDPPYLIDQGDGPS